MDPSSNVKLNRRMSSKSDDETSSSNILYLNKEKDRLKTFAPWTNEEVDKAKLAKFGFFLTSSGDCVKCIYCEVSIASWGRGDDPLREHIHWAPSCPFLLHNAPVNEPIEPNFEKQLPSPEYFVEITNDTDINQVIILYGDDAIRHPAYKTHAERLKSFKNWPKSIKLSPQKLSEAGFFYVGKSDHVKCFHCGGALRDFEENDDAWIEHAKYYDCDYVEQTKGQAFIEQARSMLGNDDDEENEYNCIINEEDSNPAEEDSNPGNCNICQLENLNAIMIPCMHVYSCMNCAFSFTHCPVCRQKITKIQKCHIS